MEVDLVGVDSMRVEDTLYLYKQNASIHISVYSWCNVRLVLNMYDMRLMLRSKARINSISIPVSLT